VKQKQHILIANKIRLLQEIESDGTLLIGAQYQSLGCANKHTGKPKWAQLPTKSCAHSPTFRLCRNKRWRHPCVSMLKV